MMSILKYVRLPGNEIIIFPGTISHALFCNLNPVSAGFCEVSVKETAIACFGGSETLGLQADWEKDSELASLQFFGTCISKT